jgi:hypothetical protein
MNHSTDAARSRLPWRGRALLASLLLVGLLVSTAFAPASMLAPLREAAVPGMSSVDAPGVDRSAQPLFSPDVDAPRTVANQGDPEPGIVLITAVYNSIQDRFFKPLDSRDLLDAAWEGARRSLAEQRRLPNGVDEPVLTGDRAGDLDAFVTQYRALLTAAGTGIDANRVAMATSDLMTQSVGEQHTVFLSPHERFGAGRPRHPDPGADGAVPHRLGHPGRTGREGWRHGR